ncbi:hypothetical protein N9917_02430 [Deltaproteobacteria bacterium]|nr:hypothetical protein [Deltaproteobacteria bacterium]
MTKKPEKKRRFNWKRIKAEWEIGKSPREISAKKNTPSYQAINKRRKDEGWTRNLEETIQNKVVAKVAGLVDGENREERDKAIDGEASRRAAVEQRHREEPNEIIELLNESLKTLKETSKLVSEPVNNPADETRREGMLFRRKIAHDDLKAAKLGMEIQKGCQEMQRKSFRLDTSPPNVVNIERIERVIIG